MVDIAAIHQELSRYTESNLAIVPRRRGPQSRPTVWDCHEDGLNSLNLLDFINQITGQLVIRSGRRYKMEQYALAYEHSAVMIERHRVLRGQWNMDVRIHGADGIAMRIGRGYFLSAREGEGVVDYTTLIRQKIPVNPADFDGLVGQLDNYLEAGPDLGWLAGPHASSNWFINDNPKQMDVWRFFGRLINSEDHPDLFADVGTLVNEIIRVFDLIQNSGFE